ncbi:MAG: hypothetical protein HYX61_08545 [Gammaproteobacteria bacterium]|jgi:hypothetical protein|nr:hypothetical protein [Gammaproteobacteria bacterium]
MFKSNALLKIAAISLPFFFMLSNQLLSANTMPENLITITIPLLVLDEDIGLTMPRAFRTSLFEYKPTIDKVPTREGLDSLKVAGSAQFSKQSLEQALKSLDGPVWIIDLRNESHGFINGIPISWYSPGNQSNIGESDDNIQRQEQMLFNDIARQPAIMVDKILEKSHGNIKKTKSMMLKISNVSTESALVNSLNLGYMRIGVLDHHGPEDADVTNFVEFIKTVPPESWLYFHCRGGRGRSTTFMVMYDILRNAKKVSLNDIVQRQALLGGINLFKIPSDEDDEWKKQAAIDRKNFITKFYQYAKDPKGLDRTSWSQWIAKHK